MKKGILLVICCIFTLILSGCGKENLNASIINNEGKEEKLSYNDLIKIYNENDERFKSLYVGANISLNTKVEKISKGIVYLEGNYIVKPNSIIYNLDRIEVTDAVTLNGKIEKISEIDDILYIDLESETNMNFNEKSIKNEWIEKSLGKYDCSDATFEFKIYEDKVIVEHISTGNGRSSSTYPTFDNDNKIVSWNNYWEWKFNENGDAVRLEYNNTICPKIK